MGMSGRSLTLFLLALALCGAVVTAQTTGGIEGRVTDEDGGVLPGVAVEAKGAALQGVRTALSEADGSYRLSLLPPGDYVVTFQLEGFAIDSKSVTVDLDRDSTLNSTLRGAATEEITVSGEAPVVDTTSTDAGREPRHAGDRDPAHAAQLLFDRPGHARASRPTPTRRTRTSPRSPSTAPPAPRTRFYIDGVNTTGVEYGFQGKELNFEFIQAVDVKTGGYEAEYGRSTGGIINVITKSGGNELHGDVFGYCDDDSLQSCARRRSSSTSGTDRGLQPRGLRHRPRRLLRQGQALVLRRLRPGRQQHRHRLSGGPHAGRGRRVDERPRPGAPRSSPGTSCAGQSLSAPSSRTRATTPARSTTPHRPRSERRAAHLSRRRRTSAARTTRCATRASSARQVGVRGPGGAPRGGELRSLPASAAGDIIQFATRRTTSSRPAASA